MDILSPNPEVALKPRNISNSEVTSFLTCKRQYDFAFIEEIEPNVATPALDRGTLGHYAFELYCHARMNGDTHDLAMQAAMEAFLRPPGNATVDVIMNTQFLFVRYMNHHKGWPEWRILGAEVQHDKPLTPTLNMTIKYDLYVEEIATGKRLIGDYKFTYEFWRQEDHDLNGQMPKYVAVLQANGIQCDGGFLEEVRTRDLGPEKCKDPRNLWRRTKYTPSLAKKREVLAQHIAAARQIEQHRTLSPEERRQVSLPVLNRYGACKFCNFTDLCNSMLEGKQDLSIDIRTGYRKSTYGYNKELDTGLEGITSDFK